MNRGDLVTVIDCGDRRLSRVVVQITSRLIFISTKEEYELAAKEGREPEAIGFPENDVSPA